MKWNKALIEKGGQRSSVPNKFFYAFKHLIGNNDAKITNKKAIKIVKINRHMRSRRIPHIVLEGYSRKDNLSDDEKNKIKARVSKMTQELVVDGFIYKIKPLKNKKEIIQQSSAKYDLSPIDGLLVDFDIQEQLGLELKAYPNTYIKDSPWSKESLIYGFLQIPNALIDKHREIGITELELLFLLCLLVKGEELSTTDDDKIFPFSPRTVLKYRESLKSKGIIRAVPFEDGYVYNFTPLQIILCDLAGVEMVTVYEEKLSVEDHADLKKGVVDDIWGLFSPMFKSAMEEMSDLKEQVTKLKKELRVVKGVVKNGGGRSAMTPVKPKKKLSYEIIPDEVLRRKMKKYNTSMGKTLSDKDMLLVKDESFVRLFKQIDDRLMIEPVMNYVYDKKFNNKGTLGDSCLTSVFHLKIFEWIRREAEIESDRLYGWIIDGSFDKYITSDKIDVDKAANELGLKIIRNFGLVEIKKLDGNHVDIHTAKLDIYNRMHGYDQEVSI